MKLFVLVIFALVTLTAAQSKEDAINNIFSSNSSFFDFYEEVTQPPLKGIGALTKCGEGDQLNRFVCVPYYNCNPNTKTVEENSDLDGAGKIDIRMQDTDSQKCDHYLEVCCGVPDSADDRVIPPTSRPTSRPTPKPTPPSEDTGSNGGDNIGGNTGGNGGDNTGGNTGGDDSSGARFNATRRVNCGIRNSQGLDFNLVGQTNEANYGEFPWMLAILRKNPSSNEKLAVCGGSLIGPRVVLTGAHCVKNVDLNSIKIRAGEWDAQTDNERIPYQERNVVQIITHEHFMKGNLYNDVALLILDRPLSKTASVGTVCLPQQNQHFDSRECFATGWGKDIFGQQGRYAVILKKLQLPLVSNDDCQKALRKTRLGNSFILHRSFTCAGGEPNLDTCTGDGGSPLVCPDPNNPNRYLQVGIVAWGIGCGENQVPGVYVDVASFREWIDNKLLELQIDINSYIL